MKLPAKIQYAAKAMMELGARSVAKAPVTLDSIAASQKIPRDFLVQLLHRLTQAGLTKSVRGTSGGYLLARPPSKITLLDVVSTMDKQIAAEDAGAASSRSSSSYDEAIQGAWRVLNQSITASLSVSIEELLRSAERSVLDYQI